MRFKITSCYIRLKLVAPIGKRLTSLVHVLSIKALLFGLNFAHVQRATIGNNAEHHVFVSLIRTTQ